MNKIKVWVKDSYLDGGTEQVMTNNGEEIYYIDHRIGSKTDGKVFNHYPDDKETPLDIELEIAGIYSEWLSK